MKLKTNEQIIAEVKQRKIMEETVYDRKRTAAEISHYQRQDAERKYNDIRNLLIKMNVPAAGDQ